MLPVAKHGFLAMTHGFDLLLSTGLRQIREEYVLSKAGITFSLDGSGGSATLLPQTYDGMGYSVQGQMCCHDSHSLESDL